MTLYSPFKDCLPINRKEVYYTATVLPCIVCADGFAHIHRLLQLLGIDSPPIDVASELDNIQFLTEYNAKQSIYLESDKERFPLGEISGDTPDVLILINRPLPLVISIEAKMYDTVNTGSLLNQLRRQHEKVLEPLLRGVSGAVLVQVALLPAEMGITADELSSIKLLRWEQILDEFSNVSSASYFLKVLDKALKSYKCLRNEKLIFHANMEVKMTGEEIVKRYDDGTLEFLTMGRTGGSTGAKLANDLTSGNWRTQDYELSSKQSLLTKRNWFTIKDFVDQIRRINSPS